jgi:acyl-CoA thioester hydrolase
MARIYEAGIVVGEEAIDANGHVNNREYLRWMQDVATAHSAEQGWPRDRYFDEGATWVVRSHFVEYLRPAVSGDAVRGSTWVHSMATTSSMRRYLFRRSDDDTVLARAETLWVFVDLRSGRPRRIPGELRSAFPLVGEPEVAESLGASYDTAGRGGAS